MSLGDKVISSAGSTEIDVTRQIEWVETCTKQHVDGIAVTALDPDALAPSLKAAAAGVKVISSGLGRANRGTKKNSSSRRPPKRWERRSRT